MIHTRACAADGRCTIDLPVDELRDFLQDPRHLVWVDLECPTPDEIERLGGILCWEPLTVEDLVKQGQRAKLEQFDGYTYLVMHALTYDGAHPHLETPEIDFVIGRNYVVTVHPVALQHITEHRHLAHRTEASMKKGADHLLYVLVDQLVDSYFPVIDAMDDAVEELEGDILGHPSERQMPLILSMKRDAVTLRKVIGPQLEMFTRLTNPALGIVSEGNVIYFRDVHDHLIRVFESISGYRDEVGSLLEAYLSTVSNRMNEVMKRLTILASLFLPITFVTGVFGMNFGSEPQVLHDNGHLFWISLAAMAAISAVQWWYFRRKGWV